MSPAASSATQVEIPANRSLTRVGLTVARGERSRSSVPNQPPAPYCRVHACGVPASVTVSEMVDLRLDQESEILHYRLRGRAMVTVWSEETQRIRCIFNSAAAFVHPLHGSRGRPFSGIRQTAPSTRSREHDRFDLSGRVEIQSNELVFAMSSLSRWNTMKWLVEPAVLVAQALASADMFSGSYPHDQSGLIYDPLSLQLLERAC